MKKLLRGLLIILFALTGIPNLFAQSTPNDSTITFFDSPWIYPVNPAPTDSVFMYYSYESTDGCPDYSLVLDSIVENRVYVSKRNIIDFTGICTTLITQFEINLYLGNFESYTEVYLNGEFFSDINPSDCTYDKKGIIVFGKGACEGKTFIQEYSGDSIAPKLYLMEQLIIPMIDPTDSVNTVDPIYYGYNEGDEVIFSAKMQESGQNSGDSCSYDGIVSCYEIIYNNPECTLDKKGVVVAGKNLCSGTLFIREITEYHSIPRLYAFFDMPGWDDAFPDSTTNSLKSNSLKIGDVVNFTAMDYDWNYLLQEMPDSMNIIPEDCNIVGFAFCYEVTEAAETYNLKGNVFAGKDSLTSGSVLLFAKDFNKALNTAPVNTDGSFEFDNLTEGEYTVYVIPELTPENHYLPTFYKSEVKFSDAGYFYVNDSVEQISVYLRNYVKPVGTGKIWGNIYFNSGELLDTVITDNCNCKLGAFSSVYYAINVPVILYNYKEEAVDWTLTDETGNYVFKNIALDSYKVVSETAAAFGSKKVDLTIGNTDINADLELKKSDNNNTKVENPSTISAMIYPNPTNRFVNIEVNAATPMQIINVEGQKILQQELISGKNTIDLNTLVSGFYFINIGDKKIKLMKK